MSDNRQDPIPGCSPVASICWCFALPCLPVVDDPRVRLDRLTDRWRARHAARLAVEGRQPADAQREARARDLFPWREQSPAAYAAAHGAAMVGYTYDAYTYTDADLDAWLLELGAALRRRGLGG